MANSSLQHLRQADYRPYHVPGCPARDASVPVDRNCQCPPAYRENPYRHPLWEPGESPVELLVKQAADRIAAFTRQPATAAGRPAKARMLAALYDLAEAISDDEGAARIAALIDRAYDIGVACCPRQHTEDLGTNGAPVDPQPTER